MPLRLRRPAVMLGCALLLVAGCTQAVDGTPDSAAPPPRSESGTSSAPSRPSPSASAGVDVPAAEFRDCSQLLSVPGVVLGSGLKGKLDAECTFINAPLNYDDPTGETISLVAVRIHSSDNSGHDPLFLNPGGPGGSGIQLALGLLKDMSPRVLARYDLLGFDPRGVSLSAPVKCVSDSEKDAIVAASPDVTTSAGFRAAKALGAQFAAACKDAAGDKLPYINTVNTARDMDWIRASLGADDMNYLGFSYGTELGSVYAHLYPDTVRVAVLDGAVDPLTSGIEQFANQLQGFEDAFDQFAASCTSGKTPCHGMANPRATALSIENTAQRRPLLPTSSSRELTASLSATGILEALYVKDRWTKLSAALAAARDGDGSALLALADQYNQRDKTGKYSNIMDANITISCNDSEPGPSDDEIRATATDWAKRFPLFGKGAAISLFTCQTWQPERVVPPKPTADTPTKVLVLGNLHDPATPYKGAQDLTTTMGNAELLSWDGEGHTSYLQGSTCIDKYVTAYLVDQSLPSDDTTCPAK